VTLGRCRENSVLPAALQQQAGWSPFPYGTDAGAVRFSLGPFLISHPQTRGEISNYSLYVKISIKRHSYSFEPHPSRVDTHGQSPWRFSQQFKLRLTPFGRFLIHPRAKPMELYPSGLLVISLVDVFCDIIPSGLSLNTKGAT
jgi:hypothetical protein